MRFAESLNIYIMQVYSRNHFALRHTEFFQCIAEFDIYFAVCKMITWFSNSICKIFAAVNCFAVQKTALLVQSVQQAEMQRDFK